MPDAQATPNGATVGANTKLVGRGSGLRPPYKKGESGNRSGRPRGMIVPALNRELKKIHPDSRVKIAQLIAGVLVQRAQVEVLEEDQARAANVNLKAIDIIMQHTDPIEPPDNTPREVNVIIANLGQQVQLSDKDL